jgi:hypothetical protein
MASLRYQLFPGHEAMFFQFINTEVVLFSHGMPYFGSAASITQL